MYTDVMVYHDMAYEYECTSTPGIGIDAEYISPIATRTSDLEVMEYTGLHDKNGREVYEGDIVRHQDISWGTYVEKVKYENGLWNYSSGITSGSSCQKPKYHWEVIGNAWENPDLSSSEELPE